LRGLGRGHLVFLFVVVVGIALAVTDADVAARLGAAAAILGLGAVYALLGVASEALVPPGAATGRRAAYFGLLLGLAGAISFLSRGEAWLVALPLPGLAMDYGRRWTAGVSALLLAVLVLPIGVYAGWEDALRAGVALAGGILFVALFTDLVHGAEEDRARVAELAAELEARHRELRAYAVQAEELATTEERNRLAREIHDSLGHYLTVVNVQLEAARAVLPTDPARAAQAIERAQDATRECLAEVRRSVAALRASPVEGRPLPEALAALVADSGASGLPAELATIGPARPVAPPVAMALYRAAQEGLTNARRHAGASRAEVTLDFGRPQWIVLTVRDNGRGAAETEGGFGLVGARERLEHVGGYLEVITAPGEGFELFVEVPG
jgi:signal transduction histidine kinase